MTMAACLANKDTLAGIMLHTVIQGQLPFIWYPTPLSYTYSVNKIYLAGPAGFV